MSCHINTDGLHTFACIKEPSLDWISEYLTCIACGERRALSKDGILYQWDGEDWTPIIPPKKGAEQ